MSPRPDKKGDAELGGELQRHTPPRFLPFVREQANERGPGPWAAPPALIRGQAAAGGFLLPARQKARPGATPTPPLKWFTPASTIAPIPPWMLSEMKALACTGALSAPLAAPSLLVLSGIEGEKESEYSSSSCARCCFYAARFDLITAQQRIRICSSRYHRLFAVFHLTLTHAVICSSKPSLSLSLSRQLLGGFSSSFSSLACGAQLY